MDYAASNVRTIMVDESGMKKKEAAVTNVISAFA
jgi:hypothetical protein